MGLLHPFPHRYVLLLKLSIISAKVLLPTDYVFRRNKEGVALLVGLKRRFQPPPISSLTRNARRRGFLPSQFTTVPLPRSKRKMEGVSSFQPSPPSLETRDGGGFLLPNPPPSPSLARNARRRGVSFFQPTTVPLPRSKHETEGAFVSFNPPPLARIVRRRVSSFPTCHHPLSRLKRETEGAFVSFDPPLSLSLARIMRQARLDPNLMRRLHCPIYRQQQDDDAECWDCFQSNSGHSGVFSLMLGKLLSLI